MHRNVERVVLAGRDVGLTVAPREFPEGTRTAPDAAAAIGVALGQIVKSLVFRAGDRLVVALVRGDRRLDEARLAIAAGAPDCQQADAEAVRDATGYPVGGVPPFGHATRLATFVDEGLLDFDEVWAAAGHPSWCFPVAPSALVAATGGTVTAIAIAI